MFSGMTPEVNRNGPMDMNMYSVRSKKRKEENIKKLLGKALKTRVYTPVAVPLIYQGAPVHINSLKWGRCGF